MTLDDFDATFGVSAALLPNAKARSADAIQWGLDTIVAAFTVTDPILPNMLCQAIFNSEGFYMTSNAMGFLLSQDTFATKHAIALIFTMTTLKPMVRSRRVED